MNATTKKAPVLVVKALRTHERALGVTHAPTVPDDSWNALNRTYTGRTGR